MCVAKVRLCSLLAKILVSGLIQPAFSMRAKRGLRHPGTHTKSFKLAQQSNFLEFNTVDTIEELRRAINGTNRKVKLAAGSYQLDRSLLLLDDILLVGGPEANVTCAASMRGPAFIQKCGSVHLVGVHIRNCPSAFRTDVPDAVSKLENLTLGDLTNHGINVSLEKSKLTLASLKLESLNAAVLFSSTAGHVMVSESHFFNNDRAIEVNASDVSLKILRSKFWSNDYSVRLRSARVMAELRGCTIDHEDHVIRIDEEDANVIISNSTLRNNWRVVEAKKGNVTIILNSSNLEKNRAGVYGRGKAADATIVFEETKFSDSQALTWSGDRLSLDVQRCSFVGAPPSTSRYTMVVYSGGPCNITVHNCTFKDVSTAMEFIVGVLHASLEELILQDVERGFFISEDRSRPARGDFVHIKNRTGVDPPCPHLIGKESKIIYSYLFDGDYFVQDCKNKLRQHDFWISRSVVLRKQRLIGPTQPPETWTYTSVDLTRIHAASSVNLSNISIIRAHKGITIDGASNVTIKNFTVSESTFGMVVQDTFDVVVQDHAHAYIRNSAIIGNSVGVEVLSNSFIFHIDANSNLFFNEKDACYEHFEASTTRVRNEGAHSSRDQKSIFHREDPWLLHMHFNYHLLFLFVTYVAAEVLSMGPFMLQPKQAPTWKKVKRRIGLSVCMAAFAWIGLFTYVVWMYFRFSRYLHLETINKEFRFVGWMSLRVLLLSALARAAMPRLRQKIHVLRQISERNQAAEQVDRLLQSATDVDVLKDLAQKHRELLAACETGNSMQSLEIFSQMKSKCEEAIAKITPFLKAVRLELESDNRGQAIFHIPLVNSLPFAEIPEELRCKDDGQVADWLSRRAAWMRSTFEQQLQRVMEHWADCDSVSDALHKQYITTEQASKLRFDDLEPEAYPLRPLPHSRATSEHENGGLLMAPGVKKVERALVKGRKEYVGAKYAETPGVVYVTDWLRATLYSRDGLSLALAYFILENVFGGIVKAKAKLGDERLPDDQRIAILCVVNVQDDKIGFRMLCEVQLIPQDLLILKGIQHLLYEVARADDPSEIVGHPIFVDFEDKDSTCATKTPMYLTQYKMN